ncbi:heat shock 70 kDa protein 12B-like [Mercenaria mercenaria]|uniref:heat shock 70 kDa protein 12B-like n=1 Tax=Mercenaria mercenaria TaxID=6596 RepID=UPI00234E8A76|nr:heat shock 70 kDa protein 12B-like [Mercenaria mercenaria]
MASAPRLLVGAIVFGTTFSSWAFSFKHDYERDHTKATVKMWNSGTLTTEKTPTCLLLKPDGTFDAFGYDAESRYRELADNNDHMHYYFFRHFKMSLFKQLGRAGTKKEQLTIALEPVHGVQDQNTLREVVASNVVGWGGIMVNKAFEDFLKELAGKDVFEQFKVHEIEDWLCMQREFEVKKREIRNSARRVLMHLPASTVELCEKERKLCFIDVIASTRYAELVEIKRDNINISKIVLFYLFGDPTKKTVMYVKKILNYNETKDIKAILMVGGFCESPLLQHAVKEAFPEEQVLIPSNVSSTVLRGALIFGHNPECITVRTLKYTNGDKTTTPFKAWLHAVEKN